MRSTWRGGSSLRLFERTGCTFGFEGVVDILGGLKRAVVPVDARASNLKFNLSLPMAWE